VIEAHVNWVEKLVSKAAKREKLEKKRSKQDAAMSQLAGRIEEAQNQLRDIMDLTVQTEDGKKQKTLDYKERKQTAEFDIDDVKDGFFKMSPDDLEKHAQAAQMIESLYDQLADLKDPDDDSKSLFDDEEELAEELYSPLKREGLLPETFIPNKFSETHEMTKETFALYGERLKKEQSKGFLDDNYNLGMACLSLGFATVSGVGNLTRVGEYADATVHNKPTEGLFTSENDMSAYSYTPDGANQYFQNPYLNVANQEFLNQPGGTDSNLLTIQTLDASGNHLKQVGAIGDLLGMASDYLIAKPKDVYADINEATAGGASQPTGRQKQAPQIAAAIVSTLAATVGAKLKDTGMGLVISSALGTFVKAGDLSKELGGKELADKNIENVVDTLSAALKKTIELCDPAQNGHSKEVTDSAKKVETEFANLKNNAAKVVKALEEPNIPEVLKIFATAAAAAAGKGNTPELQKLLSDSANLRKAQKNLKAAEEKQANDDLAQAYAADDAEQKELEELAKDEKQAQQLAAKLKKRIEKLKRDKLILKWATTVVGMAFDQAAKAVAPLACVGGALKMVLNIYEAVKRHRDWMNFAAKQGPILKAASVYTPALDNFIGNAQMQAMHYDLNAALEGAKIIGACLQMGGITAPAGVATSALAGLTQNVEAVVYEAMKRYKLEEAWKAYKRALVRPENRKLQLIAMQENPTLAKYAVAYGAIIKKDPLVSDFMTACDLNEENLKLEKENENVHLVVEYLEARMPDDVSVVGRDVGVTDWAPAKLELTVACWSTTKMRAQSKAKMDNMPTPDLDVDLARFEKAYAPLKSLIDAKQALPPAQVKECEAVIAAVISGFRKCSPQKSDKENKNVPLRKCIS
jgi:hypothetical protein